MAYSYVIDVENNLIRKTHFGVITVDEEIAALDNILSDPDCRKGMNTVCDFTEAIVEWSLSEIDQFRAYIGKIKRNVGNCKWAIVFPGGKSAATAKMFVAMHKAMEDTIEVELFKNPEAALSWIQGVAVNE